MENLFKILNGEEFKEDRYAYIEVQIHGDITWKNDVEKLMINKRHSGEKKRLDQIGLPYEFI
jgi:tRNA G37 N-methylase Trm5